MLDVNSPLEAFLHWEQTAPKRIFLKQPLNREVINFSFAEAGKEARKIGAFLKGLNFPDKSHIALMSKNCAHWPIADLAIMMAGHVSIPIYPTLDPSSIRQILSHSESKAIIIGKLDDFEKQKPGLTSIPVISVGLYGLNEGNLWEDLIKNSIGLKDSEINVPGEDDLHTIIYTSGTTGTPKGVMHTVGNFMESTSGLIPSTQYKEGGRVFSYLPMAHVAERIIEVISIRLGLEISFSESLETFAEDLERTQPHNFFGVPRIFAKFQEKILDKLPQKKLNVLLKTPIINRIVKKKLKKKLGWSSAAMVSSGAAPLSTDIIDWYQSIGVTITQIYGMTEDCCLSHFNWPENRVGTVGKPFDGVSVKLSPENEILIKNNCLMKGYYKAPDLTAQVFDEDGYFRTGDKGEYDHDGFLTIIGRAKDEFKTDKGKYVSPAYLELELAKNKAIETICVVGTGIPQPIALITLSESGKNVEKQELISSLNKTLLEVNPHFEKHEKIEKFVIMKEYWTIDNGLITPSLKVKRNAIEKLHQPYYKKWFTLDQKIIFED